MSRDPYQKLERLIAADERGGILNRWRYGLWLLEAKTGRKQLPHGLSADLITAAQKRGWKLSEREIQYRLRCAEAYDTEAKVRSAAADLGSWRALCDASFPAVETADPTDAEAVELATPADEWEQLTLIPGLKDVLSIRGRKVPLADATVADVAEYRDVFASMHESFGKTLALIESSLEAMRDGSDDDTANAVEAFKRGIGDDEPDADAEVSAS